MVKITNQSGEEAWYEGEDNISTDNLQKKRQRENPWKIWKTMDNSQQRLINM